MKQILVVRRDNIGDLVCTTPMLTLLRQRYPDAEITLLACSYNAPILENCPDIDDLCFYVKAKHRGTRSRFSIYLERFRLLRRLRRKQIDLAILATPSPDRHGLKLARQAGAARIIGVDDGSLGIKDAVTPDSLEGLHQVEKICRIAGFKDKAIPALSLAATPEEQQYARQQLANSGATQLEQGIAAFHISARKACNQWPAEKFAELINAYRAGSDRPVMLLWSPGSQHDPQHPGDDEKLEQLLQLTDQVDNIIPFRTENLRQLVGALSLAQIMVCSDGGAMHVASGLGVPVVALFGYPGADQWRPWGQHRIMHKEPLTDLTSAEVLDAMQQLA
ncbi:glycosyltransferase family 9 protein [Neptuniibacter halophilus]|uniref:glycosyltransferase family 9 protein n=1 Tax=Neptuniibacter halophilus TaxID=651666 RepID=UPI002573ADB6|nr:glycosyltransferase family 9 protein [Neptuniibacter halophilus]